MCLLKKIGKVLMWLCVAYVLCGLVFASIITVGIARSSTGGSFSLQGFFLLASFWPVMMFMGYVMSKSG